MICKQCGAKIDDDATVCEFCGATYGDDVVENDASVEQVDENTEAETYKEDDIVDTPESKDEIDELLDENEAKMQAQAERIRSEKQLQLDEIEKRRRDKKRKQKLSKIVAIVVALIVASGIGFGVYYLTLNNDKDNDVVIVTPRPTTSSTVMPTETPGELPTVTPSATVAPDISTAAPVQATKKPSSSTSKATAAPKSATKNTSKPAVKNTQKPVAKPTAKPVQVKNSINSALVTGGSVIKANGKTYMSFTMDGDTYYAKVSDNTTNDFIAGKPMTISAYKTDETYNGKTVYAISKITHYNGNYIFPQSGSKLLTESDLAGKTAWELRVGRNEIYARHGRKFNDSALQNYFNSCSWYKQKSTYNYSDDNANLNSVEKANVKLIKSYESK